ncbi:hypothetical protein Pcinc_041859 [Petrolisthes cinctipes]|uniref:Uncharacterized protein n=1 Tax=Petrolisthes cinctipes TaxID=88211 RepID=A0AAE1BJ09_PETCI|nr:hypothetical protein Pcinc_041859 [Petrolisthes cinctipes]
MGSVWVCVVKPSRPDNIYSHISFNNTASGSDPHPSFPTLASRPGPTPGGGAGGGGGGEEEEQEEEEEEEEEEQEEEEEEQEEEEEEE